MHMVIPENIFIQNESSILSLAFPNTQLYKQWHHMMEQLHSITWNHMMEQLHSWYSITWDHMMKAPYPNTPLHYTVQCQEGTRLVGWPLRVAVAHWWQLTWSAMSEMMMAIWGNSPMEHYLPHMPAITSPTQQQQHINNIG